MIPPEQRYEFIRESLNAPDFDIATFPIYDLSAKYPTRVSTERPRFLGQFLRSEHSVIYLLLGAASGALFLMG